MTTDATIQGLAGTHVPIPGSRRRSGRSRVEAELKSLLKEVGDLRAALNEHAIVAITDPRGRITYVNDKFCSISQYTREELLGQDHRLINSGSHPPEFFRALWTTIARGRVWKGEIRNRAKDGTLYWVDTTIVPFLDEHGKPRQYVAIRADITERKAAEEQIRQLNSDLERRVAERTAELQAANQELESFSYSVSHDLRSPLRGIDGFSRTLAEKHAGQLDGQGRHYLQRIRGSAQRMGQLIDDLLELARLTRSELRRTPLDLAAGARSVIAELQQSHPERSVDILIAPELRATADPILVRVVLVNLLGNAWKFTSRVASPRIEVDCLRTADGPVFLVRDNGAGFDMAYADKLFHPFQRLHSQEEFDGTGIGLATVQRIIRRHRGRIWAESQPGHGASFYFTLPD